MILRGTDVRSALRARQRGFLLNPYRFGVSGGGGDGDANTHRYWRFTGFNVSGSLLEISELQPWCGAASTRVVFSASDATSGGTTADLIDGSLSTRCYWSEAVAEGAGFWLKWDFGAPRIIDGVKLGGFDTSNRYPTGFKLQHSDDDSSWTTQATISGLSYPGNNTLSSLIDVTGGGSVANHRYWRVIDIVIPGGGFLEISEWQLFSDAVTPFPQISASSAPSGGSLSNLFNGLLNASAFWTDTVAEGAGFWIKFDFGGDALIDGAKIGAFDDSSRYPSTISLQYSDDDSTWFTKASASGLTYPGNNTLSSLISLS
jgi:hypothetical protein